MKNVVDELQQRLKQHQGHGDGLDSEFLKTTRPLWVKAREAALCADNSMEATWQLYLTCGREAPNSPTGRRKNTWFALTDQSVSEKFSVWLPDLADRLSDEASDEAYQHIVNHARKLVSAVSANENNNNLSAKQISFLKQSINQFKSVLSEDHEAFICLKLYYISYLLGKESYYDAAFNLQKILVDAPGCFRILAEDLDAKIKLDILNQAYLLVDDVIAVPEYHAFIIRLLRMAIKQQLLYLESSSCEQTSRCLELNRTALIRLNVDLLPIINDTGEWNGTEDKALALQLPVGDGLREAFLQNFNDTKTLYDPERLERAQKKCKLLTQHPKMRALRKNQQATSSSQSQTSDQALSQISPMLNIDALKDQFKTKFKSQMFGFEELCNTIALRLGVVLLENSHNKPKALLLIGGLGTGKTTVSTILAKTLDRSLISIKGSELLNTSSMLGDHQTLTYAEPGRLAKAHLENTDDKPLLIFIDELGHVDERTQALISSILDGNSISDSFLMVKFDFNDVFFVFTCNSGDSILAKLRDRVAVVEFPRLNSLQRLKIVERLWKEQGQKMTQRLNDYPWPILSEDACRMLCSITKDEDGARKLRDDVKNLAEYVAEKIHQGISEEHIIIDDIFIREAIEGSWSDIESWPEGEGFFGTLHLGGTNSVFDQGCDSYRDDREIVVKWLWQDVMWRIIINREKLSIQTLESDNDNSNWWAGAHAISILDDDNQTPRYYWLVPVFAYYGSRSIKWSDLCPRDFNHSAFPPGLAQQKNLRLRIAFTSHNYALQYPYVALLKNKIGLGVNVTPVA